ncbi:MAG: electron transfer flavoprotein subunit alpha/FixB family protein [Gaiellaceae bacterium]
MSTLVYVEQHEGEAQRASLGVLGKAASLGSETSAVVLGDDAKAVAATLGDFGAAVAFAAETPALSSPLPQARVDALAGLIEDRGFETVLFASTVLTADIAAGLASRLGAGLNWGLVDLRADGGDLVGTQPALGDSVYAEVRWTTTPRLGLVRSGAFDPQSTGGSAELVEFDPDVAEWSTGAVLVEREQVVSEGPAIEEADVIVAGGRGLGAPEHFGLVEALAEQLGGAVGATRAVVDAGWYPYATQVGQTGKTVTPKLYIACGISGAIQHKVGMQNAGVIVAINKDKNAPIFDYCDFGVIGDVHEVVPKLTGLVQQQKNG